MELKQPILEPTRHLIRKKLSNLFQKTQTILHQKHWFAEL